MIRVISSIRPVGFDDLRAVAISILVEWGIVVGSSILVAVRAVPIFGLVEWGIVVGSSILVAVRAVPISILVEWGVVIGSSILVLVSAELTFGLVDWGVRTQEHTSQLHSPIIMSYAVFCFK